MRIVFLDSDTLGSVPLSPIEAFGELVTYPRSSRAESLERVSDADILIVNKVRVDKGLLDAAPRLKLICVAATGVNNIDLEAAAARGIPVNNVAGYSTDSVAQFAFTQILSLLCDVARYDSLVKSGAYSRSGIFTDVSSPYPELAGKTMGIIGMGTIGRRVASIASAFGMKVIYYSTSHKPHCADYPSVPLGDLLSRSDVVSIHCPLNGSTEGLIGERELSLMKGSAIMVNMARGGIVDEKALAAAVGNGTIAGAAVDVYASEPAPEDNPLLHTARPERLRLSPHVAWAAEEAIERLVGGIAGNISRFLAGGR